MILIVGALTYFPALSLGPIVEQLLLNRRPRRSRNGVPRDTHVASAKSICIRAAPATGVEQSGTATLHPARRRSQSFPKLDPRAMVKNPVMFVVEVGSVITTLVLIQGLLGLAPSTCCFVLQVTLWLWFTVLFANFAEAMAEARGKAQADTLRRTRSDTPAKLLQPDGTLQDGQLDRAAQGRRGAGRGRGPGPRATAR